MKKSFVGQKPRKELPKSFLGDEFINMVMNMDNVRPYFNVFNSHRCHNEESRRTMKNCFSCYLPLRILPHIIKCIDVKTINTYDDDDMRMFYDNRMIISDSGEYWGWDDIDAIQINVNGRFAGYYQPSKNNIYASDWTHSPNTVKIFKEIWPTLITELELKPIDKHGVCLEIDEVLVGCDPEFELIDNTGNVIEAGLIIDDDDCECSIGLDGSSDQVEIRPEPGTPRQVIKNIRNLIKEFSEDYDEFDLCDAGHTYPLGGHIHVGIGREYKPPAELVELLDDFVGRPTLKLSGDAREEYWQLGSYRKQPHGFEYRTPSASAFHDPVVAYCALQATKNICEKFFREETFEYDFNFEMPTVQDYVNIGGLTEKQAKYFVDFVDNYVPTNSIRASWKLSPMEIKKKDNTPISEFSDTFTMEIRDHWSLLAKRNIKEIFDYISTMDTNGNKIHIVFYGLNVSRGNDLCSINVGQYLKPISNPPNPVWHVNNTNHKLYIGLSRNVRENITGISTDLLATLKRSIMFEILIHLQNDAITNSEDDE